jgi:serine/threonine protein kinase
MACLAMPQRAFGEQLMAGQTLGHYRLIEKIDQGGQGVVCRARDEHLNREVAVKILSSGRLGDVAARRRFRKEALVLSELNHPKCVDIREQRGKVSRGLLIGSPHCSICAKIHCRGTLSGLREVADGGEM